MILDSHALQLQKKHMQLQFRKREGVRMSIVLASKETQRPARGGDAAVKRKRDSRTACSMRGFSAKSCSPFLQGLGQNESARPLGQTPGKRTVGRARTWSFPLASAFSVIVPHEVLILKSFQTDREPAKIIESRHSCISLSSLLISDFANN